MNRGPTERYAFSKEDTIAEFLKRLAESSERGLVEVHAYCVMGSHYHLLVRAPAASLDQAIGHLERAYPRSAPLRGPHWVVPVGVGRHLLHVSRYIHLNPVVAGLAPRPEDWPHSSFRAYLVSLGSPPWLRTATILGCFGSIGARQSYRRFVNAGLDPGTRDVHGRLLLLPARPGEEFFEPTLQGGGPLPADPVPLPVIARGVSDEFGIDPAELSVRSRRGRRAHGLARGALVLASRSLGAHRLRDIAAFLRYRSYGSAARAALRFQAAAQGDPELSRRLQSIVDRLRGSRPERPGVG